MNHLKTTLGALSLAALISTPVTAEETYTDGADLQSLVNNVSAGLSLRLEARSSDEKDLKAEPKVIEASTEAVEAERLPTSASLADDARPLETSAQVATIAR